MLKHKRCESKSQCRRRSRWKKLRVGTDFSGLEAPILALSSMGLAIDHCFACDNLPAAKLISDYYFKPNKFFSDIRLRDNESLPSVDLYVNGFPCRSWSKEGTRLGLDNAESGDLALHSLLYIQQKRPVIVVLENVIPGNGEAVKFFEYLCEYIRGLGYIADWHFANTRYYGLPQSRPRIWLVGILQNRLAHRFMLTRPVEGCIGIGDIVQPLPQASWKRLPPKTRKRERAHVRKAYEKFARKGIDIRNVPIVIDIAGSYPERHTSAKNYSPCLTRAHASSHSYWVSTKGGTMTVYEMALLQGITRDMLDPCKDLGMRPRAYASMLGDSMSLNVLCHVLSSALYSAGFVDDSQRQKLLAKCGW